MSRLLNVTPALQQYIIDHSAREHPAQAALRAETAPMKYAGMQISADQGQFMKMLVRLIGAKRCIEVGVFTGYSSLSVALALPDDGRIIACDISEEWTTIARRYWAKAGVANKIDLRIAPANETLDKLLAEGGANQYDFAFIDADKPAYLGYYERLLKLMRPNGLIMVDNTLWSGKVADPSENEKDTVALRQFNDFVFNDSRVGISMLAVGDGVTLLRKR
ncbi:SAM-dependent methyltransferase [Betaproteobacteria bacterium GR16-43]|nr:SAM-dependent methyltransferase [Betaproteobacteria bacterium GR16-43]